MNALAKSFAVAALAASIALPVSGGKSYAGTPSDTLVIAATIDDIVSLDPAEIFEFSGGDLAQNVYDTLVAFDPTNLSGGYVPGLAESWTISEDGTQYTFKMRPGVTFHSGNPVTAHDAAFSLQRAVILNKTPSFILTQFGFTAENVKEKIKAVDDMTLTIQTDKKYAASFVLNCLTATIGNIVDMKLVMEHEKDGDMGYEWLKTNSAGSGAYSLRGWKPNENYVLEANENYWRAKPEMKRVFVRHISESATQRLLIEKSDVDVARNLSPDDVAGLSGNDDVRIDEDLRGRIMYFALNQEHPILSKPEVREAFKWLVDYEGMSTSFLNGQYVVHQAFLPLTYLGELHDKPYKLDVDKAKALLAEAGHADGFDVKIYVRNAQERLEIAQSLQNIWAQAGIRATLEVGTGKQTLGVYRARKHEIYLGAWGPDYPDPHTNADTFAHNPDNAFEAKNTGKLAWRNAWDIPEMSKETEAAVQESDRDTRVEMYRKIQADHQKSSPFVIMLQKIEQTAIQTHITGFHTGSAVSSVYYWTVKK
ncbi:ABC transporter substrate-binding protein [Nisaea sp.]|uniref:ABC transporter substrate-binding protein n=1 Tax=Nisaea sp. TaxID=2024842 RepID=UPI003B528BEC